MVGAHSTEEKSYVVKGTMVQFLKYKILMNIDNKLWKKNQYK